MFIIYVSGLKGEMLYNSLIGLPYYNYCTTPALPSERNKVLFVASNVVSQYGDQRWLISSYLQLYK